MLYQFLFCKQKTAYEVRISDGSSDVCSSDLEAVFISRSSPKPPVTGSALDLRFRSVSPVSRPAVHRSLLTAPSCLHAIIAALPHGSSTRRSPRFAVFTAIHRRSKTILRRSARAGSNAFAPRPWEVGRASCRERGCQYWLIP